MKLYDLVKLKQLLTTGHSIDSVPAIIRDRVQHLSWIRDHITIDKTVADKLNAVLIEYQNIIQVLAMIRLNDQGIIDNLDELIGQASKQYFEDSYRQQFITDAVGIIKNRQRPPLTDETYTLLRSRCNLYSSFQYPAMEFCPQQGTYTDFLVANDPLYLVDVHQEFLDITAKKYPLLYQTRLRKYLVKSDPHTISNIDLSLLPVKQFGFIFSWNTFNYMPLSDIKDLLIKFKELLRPGGVVLFSYNNGDLPESVELVDYQYMSYVPKSLLVPMVESIGYEVLATYDPEVQVSWIELKNPGTLSTVKAQQALGRVIEIQP